MNNLHNDIINLPCSLDAYTAYASGHRDARHAAAELALPVQQRVLMLEEGLREIAALDVLDHNTRTAIAIAEDALES